MADDLWEVMENGHYRCKENGFVVTGNQVGNPDIWKDIQDRFVAKDDDIYVVTFPRTGTTWTQEIVYLIGENLDFEKAGTPSIQRFPYIEYPKVLDKVLQLPSPRYIKSHFPYSLLPKSVFEKKCKIIYVARNPKDTVVSYYKFLSGLKHGSYPKNFATFAEIFMQDELVYTPFWKHVLEFWEMRDEDNILFLFYEDMKKDLPNAIRSIAKFLNKQLTDQQVDQVADYCSFESMQKNSAVNHKDNETFKADMKFLRKGQVGDWKNHFTDELNSKMDQYIEKNLTPNGIFFKYE